MWTVCEFHGSNGNGFGDIWWTDNPIYFSSIVYCIDVIITTTVVSNLDYSYINTVLVRSGFA